MAGKTQGQTPVPRARHGKFAKSPEVQERIAMALAMRTRGASYREIGSALGMSTGNTYKMIQKALTEIIAEPAENLRKLELEKLDRLERIASDILGEQYEHVAANGKLAGVLDPRPRLMAIDRLLKVGESRRKLLGLDAPTQVEVTGVDIKINGIDLSEL